MSQVVIAGDTSGTVTLQAPSTAGTTVLTLPSTSGYVQAPATVGTSGQFLTSAGGGAPTWGPAGAMTLIGTYSLSGSSYAVTGLPAYANYMIIISNLANGTGTTDDIYSVQHGYGATPTYVTSGWASSSARGTTNTPGSGSSLNILYISSTGSNMYTVGGQALIEGSGTGFLSGQGLNYGGNGYNYISGGQLTTANSTITALKFISNNGYSYTGTLKLYGIS